MGTIGEDLRNAREQKGMSLSDAAERTRISRTFLQALEDGDYKVIPGEVFVTGFLRSYSAELGLNPKVILARYKEENRVNPPEPAEPEEPVNQAEPEPEKTGGLNWLLIALAVCLLAAVTWYAFMIMDEDSMYPAAPEAEIPAKVAPEPPQVLDNETGIAEKPSVQPKTSEWFENTTSAGVSAIPAEPVKHMLNLSITAVADSWYSYRPDNGTAVTGQLKPGEALLIVADEKILLGLGNAGGVDIVFNGNRLTKFGPPNAVRNILFTPDKPGVIIRPAPRPGPAPDSE